MYQLICSYVGRYYILRFLFLIIELLKRLLRYCVKYYMVCITLDYVVYELHFYFFNCRKSTIKCFSVNFFVGSDFIVISFFAF